MLFGCLLLSAAGFLAAGAALLQIEADPKNAFLFGYSLSRLALFAGTLLFAGIFLWLAFLARRRQVGAEAVEALRRRPLLYAIARVGLIGGLLWGWLGLFAPAYLFGRWVYAFERLRPFSIALGFAALLLLLFAVFARGPVAGLRAESRLLRAGAVFFAAIAVLAVFIVATGLGLKPDVMFFNIPAMPVAGVQIFPLLVFLALAILWRPAVWQKIAQSKDFRLDLVIFVLIYLATILAWSSAPPPRHPDTVNLTPENTQPYPVSDARVHDSGAVAITKGYGINFRGYTDKPLYMVFLSLLHRVAGNDYWRIIFLQVCVLAFIPPALYLFGKAFHGRALGIFIAVVTLLRQYNAIALSHAIDSSNARLLLTEVPVMLGLVLFTWCAFQWLNAPQPRFRLALLAGGLIGAASLIRLNPLLLFPFVGLVALLRLRRSWRQWLPQLALYTAGLAMLLLPWAVTGTNAEGRPWLILKFLDVFNVRYIQPSSLAPFDQPLAAAPVGFSGRLSPAAAGVSLNAASAFETALVEIDKIGEFTEFIANHTLHNFVSAVMALPNSPVYDDLSHLARREYWQPNNTWQGELPPGEAALLYLNLALVALGLGYSWIHYRWAGLLPAVIFAGYALALGFARNSGARYTVPVDWVVFFYYGLGLILALTMLRRIFSRECGEAEHAGAQPAAAGGRLNERQKLILTVALMAGLGSIIPLSNRVDPAAAAQPAETEVLAWQQAVAAESSLPAAAAESAHMVGEVYYPYHRADDISFDLMNSAGLKSFLIDREDLRRELFQGQKILVGYRTIDGVDFVSYIISLENDQPELILSTNQ